MKDKPEEPTARESHPTRPAPHPSQAGRRTREAERALSVSRESRFETLGRLGEGGMGVVDEVRDHLLDRRVARKSVRSDASESEQALEAFLREVRITARLQHPGIVAVHDARLGDLHGPSLFMPLIEGRSLSKLIEAAHREAGGPLGSESLADLVEIVVRACDAMAYAHDEGVLHRDLKPDNIMVGDYGEVFVMDWGIALERRPGETAPRADDAGVSGTPAYMASETMAGFDDLLDGRADIYSLGAVLYEIVAGHPPRDQPQVTTLEALLADVRLGRSRAQELEPGPGRPPELVRIIRRATAPDRDERHASMAELRADLRRFLRGGGTLPRRLVKAGEAIVREGEPGDAAFILVQGRCQVLQQRNGRAVVRRELGPGDVFGETALLSPGPRTATVVALEDAELVRVTAGTLEREVAALKPWLATLVRGLAALLREAERRD